MDVSAKKGESITKHKLTKEALHLPPHPTISYLKAS